MGDDPETYAVGAAGVGEGCADAVGDGERPPGVVDVHVPLADAAHGGPLLGGGGEPVAALGGEPVAFIDAEAGDRIVFGEPSGGGVGVLAARRAEVNEERWGWAVDVKGLDGGGAAGGGDEVGRLEGGFDGGGGGGVSEKEQREQDHDEGSRHRMLRGMDGWVIIWRPSKSPVDGEM